MSSHHHSRRTVLRGLFAVGCVLSIPRLGLADDKMTKAQAQYQDQPNGDRKCADCKQFISPNACALVEGNISPEGWCVFWAKKG